MKEKKHFTAYEKHQAEEKHEEMSHAWEMRVQMLVPKAALLT